MKKALSIVLCCWFPILLFGQQVGDEQWQDDPLLPSLRDALCNPLNGCADPAGMPSIIRYEQGFQDIEFNEGVNDGCWVSTGSAMPSYYWFTIQAQADGDFGFIVQAADTSEASDIDFSVWGPFSQEQVCSHPDTVVHLVNNAQPLRSSWAGGPDPTGLAQFNADGDPVTDPYDCDPIPSPGGDDFASVIEAQTGDVYAVLINDWGGDIQSGAFSIDWSPSDQQVLEPVEAEIIRGDTVICTGTSAPILIDAEVDSILWVGPNAGNLSCLNCFDPIASVTQTTTFTALVFSVCAIDTVDVTVSVFELNPIPDYQVCLGEQIELNAGIDYTEGSYAWSGPNLSCMDCPNPILTTPIAGTFSYSVTLTTPGCVLTQTFTLEVENASAPGYVIQDDQTICEGTSVGLGGPPGAGVSYQWSTVLGGTVFSQLPNPVVSPTQTTTYYLRLQNAFCPLPSIDSITIEVVGPPAFELGPDRFVCVGDTIQFSPVIQQAGVTYTWNTQTGILEPGNPNTPILATNNFEYILTAENEACVLSDTVRVTAQDVFINIQQPDSQLCQGDTLALNVTTVPPNLPISWNPTTGLAFPTGKNNLAFPEVETVFVATTSLPGCIQTDTIQIGVDSLPDDLTIQPLDTTLCEGELVQLTTNPFDTLQFLDIHFQWFPNIGFQTADTLLDMLLEAQTTTTFSRLTTNGVCMQVDTARVEVIELPTLNVTLATSTICLGDSISLLAQAMGISEWDWTPSVGLSCTDCPNPMAYPPDTSTYVVTGLFMGCAVMDSVSINVVASPVYRFPESDPICPGDTILLNLQTDPNPNTSYSWTSDPAGFFSNAPQPTVGPMVTTRYFLNLSNGVCPALLDTFVQLVLPTPELTVDPMQISLCAGETVDLTAFANVTGTFDWSGNLPDAVNVSSSTVTVQPVDTATISVTFFAPCGNPSEQILIEASEVITGDILVELDNALIELNRIGIDTLIFEGDTVRLVFVADQFIPPGSSIEWFDEEGLFLGSGLELVVNAQADLTEVEVVINKPDGCVYALSDAFEVNRSQVDMPNIFTPNGDGRNDRFRPFLFGRYTVQSFYIWNRRGELIFEQQDVPGAQAGWDGRQDGEPVPADVYLYRMELESAAGVGEVMKGEVVLVR